MVLSRSIVISTFYWNSIEVLQSGYHICGRCRVGARSEDWSAASSFSPIVIRIKHQFEDMRRTVVERARTSPACNPFKGCCLYIYDSVLHVFFSKLFCRHIAPHIMISSNKYCTFDLSAFHWAVRVRCVSSAHSQGIVCKVLYVEAISK